LHGYEENQENLPGVDYIVEMQRGYPLGIKGSHSFGYTKEISPNQLNKEKDYYIPGDYVGHNGIRKAVRKRSYEVKKDLIMCWSIPSVRKLASTKMALKIKVSTKGKDLVLSYDADVQKVAEEQMNGKRGAIVAIEPKTGEST
jgi:penicillin-binding protein 2